ALNNEAGGVVAARERLDVAVGGKLVNRDDSLLLSAGGMSLSADWLENRSARIEALGDLGVQARVLLHANDHVQVELVNGDPGSPRTVYFTPAGVVDAKDIAWSVVKPLKRLVLGDNAGHPNEWILTKASAEALGVSDPQFSTWYRGPDPYVAAHMEKLGKVKDQREEWRE